MTFNRPLFRFLSPFCALRQVSVDVRESILLKIVAFSPIRHVMQKNDKQTLINGIEEKQRKGKKEGVITGS